MNAVRSSESGVSIADEANHPWSSREHYDADINHLAYLLLDVRFLLSTVATGEHSVVQGEPVTWSVHGLQRRSILLNVNRAFEPRQVFVVGFFGSRRSIADESGIDTVERDLVKALASHDGMISYSSMELPNNQWANLVVHESPLDRESWRDNERHRHAVSVVSPLAYHAVRIHNGYITDGLGGKMPIVLESTKYWDFDSSPVWHRSRPLPGGVYRRNAGVEV